ncbi:MAG: MmcQ/YjbR family DNA-binding protein [Beijerinckiaceae bacterium]
MKPERQQDWESLKAFALGLSLPGVEEALSWGQPCLKAHGKLWVWWSPSEDAPVFKVSLEEREILVEAEPERFFFTAHYRSHPLVLVRPEKLQMDWVRANLIRVWRAQAPKRFLKNFDAAGAQ